MYYLGDIAEDATIRGSFNTRDAAGAPITLAGTPAISVYKDAGVTKSTAGVTLTIDFDSVTGLHIFTIDTSADAFYATGSDYRVVITTGTVSGISVIGVQVGSFSIQNRYSVSGSGGDATAANQVAILDAIIATGSNPAASKSPPVVRSSDNTLPITFLWGVADATFTMRRSINGGNYVDADGVVTYLRAEGGRYRYSISYVAADRPAAEGTVIYELTDGAKTNYLSLRVESASSGGGGGDVGEFLVPFTIKNALSAIVPYCSVTVTASSEGSAIEVIDEGTSNSTGRVEFKLNPGTYYLWRNKANYEFTDPVEFAVSDEGVVTVS